MCSKSRTSGRPEIDGAPRRPTETRGFISEVLHGVFDRFGDVAAFVEPGLLGPTEGGLDGIADRRERRRGRYHRTDGQVCATFQGGSEFPERRDCDNDTAPSV